MAPRERYNFFILKMVVVYSMVRPSLSYCDPKDACSVLNEGSYVPDPMDCHNYYVCIKAVNGTVFPSDQPVSCPNFFYFDPVLSQCQLELTPCYKPCPNLGCTLDCRGSPGSALAADPNDCSKYYVCLPGLPPVEAACPDSEPYFDGAVCTDSPQDCCDFCIPYCQSTYTETLDPFDCESYYLCLESTGTPSESNHFKCEEGKYFDTTAGTCLFYEDGSDECKSLCSLNVSTTPATTMSSQTESSTSMLTSQTPMVSSQTSMVTSQTPMVTTQTSMVTSQTPMVTSQTPMVTSQTPMVTSQTSMVTSQTPMVTSQTPMVTSQSTMVTFKTSEKTTLASSSTESFSTATSITKPDKTTTPLAWTTTKETTENTFVPPIHKVNHSV